MNSIHRRPLWAVALAAACLMLSPGCVGGNNGNDGKVKNGIDAGATNDGGANGDVNGTPPALVDCGNAICDEDETFFICREDCTAPDYIACYAEKCEQSWQRCLDTPACLETMHCMALCDGDKACSDTCFFTTTDEAQTLVEQLQACGWENECHGDGPQPPPVNSCPGECGEYVAGAECQCEENCKVFGDCCDDYEAVCHAPDTCGDGQCDQGENAENCPADCTDEPLDDFEICVVEHCPEQLAACQADSACNAVLECIDKCGNGDQDCQFGCMQQGGFNGALIQLGICVQGAGCLEGGPNNDCGNGQCEEGENTANCPEDCEELTNPFLQCAAQECPGQLETCLQDPSCAEIISCIEECPTFNMQGCIQGCIQSAGFVPSAIGLGTCLQQSGCLDGPQPDECGDGDCGPGENPNNCPEDCEDPGESCVELECGWELSECYEDEACFEILICLDECGEDEGCSNECWQEGANNDEFLELVTCYQENCADGPPGPICGDGVCEGVENVDNCKVDCVSPDPGECGDKVCNANETEESCPDDCKGEPTVEEVLGCIEKVCGAEWEACSKDEACNDVLECLKGCDTEDCTDTCVENASWQAWDEFEALGDCADSSGCFPADPGPDPPPPSGDLEECLKDNCEDEVEDCMENDACWETYMCLIDCVGGGCVPECIQQSAWSQAKGELLQCANQNECIGGGGPGGGPGGGGGGGGGGG